MVGREKKPKRPIANDDSAERQKRRENAKRREAENGATQIERWMAPFAPLFGKSVFLSVLIMVLGTLLAGGARTVCAALRAADCSWDRGFCRFHRVLSRGKWSAIRCAQTLLLLLVDKFSPDGLLRFVMDETHERRWGKCIRHKGIFRDAVRSTHSKVVTVSALRWMSFQLLAQPFFAARTWALPFLTILCPPEYAPRAANTRYKNSVERAKHGIFFIMHWLRPLKRKVVFVADGGFCCKSLMVEANKDGACLVTRARMDSVLYEVPEIMYPPVKRGKGRPKIDRNERINLEKILLDPKTNWTKKTVHGYVGKKRQPPREVEYTTGVSIWGGEGPSVRIRWVLLRDPKGKSAPMPLFSTDIMYTPDEIIDSYAMRWSVEVTFEESRRHIGIETQRQWTDLAIARTTPALMGLFSLVVLWATDLAERTKELPVVKTAWYDKSNATFADCLTIVRKFLWMDEERNPIMGQGLIQTRRNSALAFFVRSFRRIRERSSTAMRRKPAYAACGRRWELDYSGLA